MAAFSAVGQTHATTTPTIAVDAGLPPGTYRFRLVVVDDSGNQSAPAEVAVVVFREAIVREPIDPVVLGPILQPTRPLDPVRIIR